MADTSPNKEGLQFFTLTEDQAAQIREAMSGCDASKWGLHVRTGEDWNFQEGTVENLLTSSGDHQTEGIEGLELGLFFNSDVTVLGDLATVAKIYLFTHLSPGKLTDLSGLAGLTNLQSLNLGRCDALTDVSVLAELTGLQRLNLRYYTALTDVSGLAGLTNLQSLNLSRCEALTDVSGLAGLTNLQSLNLSRCEALTDVSGLAGLTNLQSLNLSGCEALTDVSVLAGLTNLQSLNLERCKALTDVSVLAGLTNLQSLNLGYCPALTDVSVLAGLTNLQSLNLGYCPALTDVSVLAELTGLQRLNLSFCKALTDVSVLVGLTNLQSLNLSSCDALTDLSVLAGLTNLQSLNLRWCKALTDVSGLAGLTNLQSLDLSRCKALTDVSVLAGLTNLQSLNLSRCEALTDVSGLAGLTNLQSLNLSSCGGLTHIKPLLQLPVLQSLKLDNSGNIRDLDRLSNCAELRELTWTETPACHAVLAATAVLREDPPFIAEQAKAWLDSVRLSKAPDTFIQRLVAAFALGGSADWAVQALTTLATEARARGMADEGATNAISADSWAAWSEAVVALGDPALCAPIETALYDLNPRREVECLLTPVLTALADLPTRAPQAKDWALPLVDGVLAPLTADPDTARQAAPAAAVFYAAFGLDDQVRTWLDHGSHQHSPRWRDRVMVALLEWSANRGDLSAARDWLAQIQTPDMRDPAHMALARAMATQSPEQAVTEHLEAIEDEVHRAALAAELATVPEVTNTTEGLYGLLLVMQEDSGALADLLERLVVQHPDNPLVTDIAAVFGGGSASAGNDGGPLMARLQQLDLNTLTPMAAFTLVTDLKTLADGDTP
jgi:Leucine-rich repeat (LRR) protein